mgnify:CR=1 FL=1
MTKAKKEIIGWRVFSIQNPVLRTAFAAVNANTQKSCFLQREIEQFTTEMKPDKNLPTIGNAPITRRVHDQRLTNLCVSYSIVSTLRGAATNHLTDKGINQNEIRNDLENVAQFSFTKMLTLFTGCVSPRSLDGLIVNSKFDGSTILTRSIYINAQLQQSNDAIDRLVNKTEFEIEGWKRIRPIAELFRKYNVNPDNLKLESIPVYHNRIANNDQLTFQEALRQGMLIVATIFCNTISSITENYPHAVTMFDFDQNMFKIKNSYFAEKMVTIDERLPVYDSEFQNKFSPEEYLAHVKQIDPDFDDYNYILFDTGCCIQFR